MVLKSIRAQLHVFQFINFFLFHLTHFSFEKYRDVLFYCINLIPPPYIGVYIALHFAGTRTFSYRGLLVVLLTNTQCKLPYFDANTWLCLAKTSIFASLRRGKLYST